MRKKIGPLIIIFLLFLAGFFARTQETGTFDLGPDSEEGPTDETSETSESGEDPTLELELGEETAEEIEIPDWVRPARWFRSNAGGMTLEEIPSRLAALRYEYALVIDFINIAELPEYLLPYYGNRYFIEVRILYTDRAESRRQYLFRDQEGTVRLVAAFNPTSAEPGEEDLTEEEFGAIQIPRGFIETYNENQLITAEYQFSDDGDETKTEFFYNRGAIIRAETWRQTVIDEVKEFTRVHTDHYRYNRSSSLRAVERIYHEAQETGESGEVLPVRLAFPNRVLDAAKDDAFISDRLAQGSGFFGDTYVESGYRMVFTTDARGRILTQTLLDNQDETVWVIENTWSGNQISLSSKTEGDDVRLTEYEYNSAGEWMIERNSHNGDLERLVRTEGGGREVEELYMNGEVILRAIWEDGRKISEVRVRSRE
ncbi:hypothetical protein AGMMS50293_27880 [Spirochaetia bacterium]|nr:hypothetical protein AGMMS50293_27880 [Spirochaetia bacterium]